MTDEPGFRPETLNTVEQLKPLSNDPADQLGAQGMNKWHLWVPNLKASRCGFGHPIGFKPWAEVDEALHCKRCVYFWNRARFREETRRRFSEGRAT